MTQAPAQPPTLASILASYGSHTHAPAPECAPGYARFYPAQPRVEDWPVELPVYCSLDRYDRAIYTRAGVHRAVSYLCHRYTSTPEEAANKTVRNESSPSIAKTVRVRFVLSTLAAEIRTGRLSVGALDVVLAAGTHSLACLLDTRGLPRRLPPGVR